MRQSSPPWPRRLLSIPRRLSGDRHGSAILEFALTAGMLMTLLTGIIAFGMTGWTRNAYQVAAGATARCVALGTCTDPASYAADQVAFWGLGGTLAQTTISRAATSCHGTTTTAKKFVTITLQSQAWRVMPAFQDLSVQATACYPMAG